MIQIDRLKQPPIKPLAPKPAAEVADLPTSSFLEEEAEIDCKQVALRQVEQDWSRQQRKIDLVQSLDPKELTP